MLVTVAFTIWRLFGNLKSLTASVADLSDKLAPALKELETQSATAAEHAACLSERAAKAGRAGGRRRR